MEGEAARVTFKTMVVPCAFDASVTFSSDTIAVELDDWALTGEGYGTSEF
jgi:hypothetical protein